MISKRIKKSSSHKKITSFLIIAAVLVGLLNPKNASADLPLQAVGAVAVGVTAVACPVCILGLFGAWGAVVGGMYLGNAVDNVVNDRDAMKVKWKRIHYLRYALKELDDARPGAEEIVSANCDFEKLHKAYTAYDQAKLNRASNFEEFLKGNMSLSFSKNWRDTPAYEESEQPIAMDYNLQFDSSGVLLPSKLVYSNHSDPQERTYLTIAQMETRLLRVGRYSTKFYSPEARAKNPAVFQYACLLAQNFPILEASMLTELRALLPELFNKETGAPIAENAKKYIYRDERYEIFSPADSATERHGYKGLQKNLWDFFPRENEFEHSSSAD